MMSRCSHIQRLLVLLFVEVHAVVAFPTFVFCYANSRDNHFHLRAFLSNSDIARPVRRASRSTSKQLFADAKDTSGNDFLLDEDEDYGESKGSVSGEPDVALSGTHNRTYFFLKHEVGLSEKAMQKVMQTMDGHGNSLLRFQAPNLGYKIETLSKTMNLTDKEVCTIIEKFPNVLSCSADDNIAPTLSFLEELLELNQTDLRKLVLRSPVILGTNTANLQAKIDFFVDSLDLSTAELRKMLVKNSMPLALSLEKMQGTIGYLRCELGLTEEQVKRVVCKYPSVFGFQLSNLDGNVEFLRQAFSFTDEQLRRVIIKYPALFTYSIENNLQPKVEYLREALFGGDDNAMQGAVLGFPALLTYSLEGRIRPRLGAILEAGFDPSILTIGIQKKEEDFVGWLQRKIDERDKKKDDPLW